MKEKASPYPRSTKFISVDAWKFLLGHFKGSTVTLIFTSLFTAATYLAVLPTLWLVRYIFDTAIPQDNYQAIIWVALALIGIRICTNLLSLFLKNVNVKVVTSSIYNLRMALLHKVTELSRKYHQSQDYRVLQTRLVQDTERISQAMISLISAFLPAVVGALVIFILLLTIHWQLTLIITLGGPLIYLINRVMKKRLKDRVFTYQRAFEDFSKGNLFLLRFMDLIRVSAAERLEVNNQKQILTKLKKRTHKRAITNTLYNQLLLLVSGLLGSVVLAIGGIAVAKGTITLGSFLAFYMAANFLNQQLATITGSFNVILNGNESVITLHEIVGETTLGDYQGTARPKLQGSFTFEEVAFAYGQEPYVFEHINFSINRHEILALVGPNGAGKSTLINLLLGIYKPSKGRLLADDHPYEDLNMEHLRQSVGMVFQHAYLVPGTIRENICYGLTKVDEAKMIAASKMAMAHDFISKLEDGYDSATGEDGVFLSGGERQRIAIARAILREPKLLILDEPTNHLDAESVEVIMDRVVREFQETSVLLISHNKEVIGHADRVLELRDKQIKVLKGAADTV